MSDSTTRAVTLAIAALYDIAEDAGKGPVAPNLTLRALLALLYEASHDCEGRNRASFVDYWKTVTNPGLERDDEGQRNYIRSTYPLIPAGR